MLIALVLTLTGCLATAHADDGSDECGCDGPELVTEVITCIPDEVESTVVPIEATGISMMECTNGKCHPWLDWSLTGDTLRPGGSCEGEVHVSYWVP